MKLSARNTLPGIVGQFEPGAASAEVQIAPDITIVSVITADAVKNLNLIVGARAYAVIKASSVMIGTD